MEYHEKLKRIRQEKNISQEKIARRLETTQQMYNRYENGKIDIPTKRLKTICEYLNISTDYLLDIDQNKRGKEQVTLDAKEAIEDFYNEIISVINGATEQNFSKNDLIKYILEDITEIKEKYQKETKK